MAKKLVVTLGDPNSIGPEVGAKALLAFLPKSSLMVEVHGSLTWVAGPFQKKLARWVKSRQLRLVPAVGADEFKCRAGSRSTRAARLALEHLKSAALHCLEEPRDRALVTGPIDKDLCARVIPKFSGHTGYLQKLTHAPSSIMMLSGGDLRVSLVTTHIPLKDVASRLSTRMIVEAARQTHDYLRRQTPRPRLGILGLNPHASDRGAFGSEEAKIIAPAIQKLRKMGVSADGPLSPDAAFTHDYDAFVCMYHDQGLIPLKMKYFFDAVNITLGLPFLRTSVDHGTAFNIAGKNIASEQSFINALWTASRWLRSH